MRASKLLPAALALALAAWPRADFACGLCHEDNRAAVYSYQAMEKVRQKPQELEFVVLKVIGSLPEKTIQEMTLWFSRRPEVDASTLKISGLQKSIGFVFEKAFSQGELVSDLGKAFPELGFRVLKYESKETL